MGGDFVEGCNRASADAAVAAEPFHGDGMYPCRRKFLVTINLLLVLGKMNWSSKSIPLLAHVSGLLFT